MISDKRLAEIEAAISRVAEAAHGYSLPDCCAGCVAELALADLLEALRAERERVAVLEGALWRRIESDDAQEGGACDCAWCVEDRALVAEETR